jgi:transposase
MKKLEDSPVNLSTVARMWAMPPKLLYHYYRNFLSSYQQDKLDNIWGFNQIDIVDTITGVVVKQRPVYIAKPENMGSIMAIDDKQIGKDMFTILTNQQTGKIALLVETLKVKELSQAISYLGDTTRKVESISCDMSPTYLSICEDTFSKATIVVDKFHVMQYVIDAVQSVRIRIKNDLMNQLSEEKKAIKKNKTKETKETKANKKAKVRKANDTQILSDLELLKRSRYLLSQSDEGWNDYQIELMRTLFEKFSQLKDAYDLCNKFRKWYDSKNILKNKSTILDELNEWYRMSKVSLIKEFISVVKMIKKHQNNILNYFIKATTNAIAENMNSRIQRFVINNYGIRDKDFAMFRISKYFS